MCLSPLYDTQSSRSTWIQEKDRTTLPFMYSGVFTTRPSADQCHHPPITPPTPLSAYMWLCFLEEMACSPKNESHGRKTAERNGSTDKNMTWRLWNARNKPDDVWANSSSSSSRVPAVHTRPWYSRPIRDHKDVWCITWMFCLLRDVENATYCAKVGTNGPSFDRKTLPGTGLARRQ